MINKAMAIYFYDERIRLCNEMMACLDYPKYIHILIDENNKHLFIKLAETRDNDTFRIVYSQFGTERRYRISSKWFVKRLAALIGVKFPSNSIWFEGYYLEKNKSVFIDLKNFHITEYISESDSSF